MFQHQEHQDAKTILRLCLIASIISLCTQENLMHNFCERGQGKAGQGRVGQGRAGQGGAGWGGAGKGGAGWGTAYTTL